MQRYDFLLRYANFGVRFLEKEVKRGEIVVKKGNGRKNANEMHEEAELMLLKGDVIYDGMACRTMNDVTADCQSAKYEEKNKREPDDSRTEQKYTSG